MYKAELKDASKPNTILPIDMKVGQIGVIVPSAFLDYTGQIVLRTFDSLVSLTRPQSTWSNLPGMTMEIRVLPNAVVTITGAE